MQNSIQKFVLITIAAPILSISLCGAYASAKTISDLDLLAPGAKMTNPDSFTPPAITNDNNDGSSDDSQSVTVQPLPENNTRRFKTHNTQQFNQQSNDEQQTFDPTVQADQRIQNATERTNEMALNNDVESLEQFGDAAAAKTAQNETRRLTHEDTHLRYQAIVLKRQTNQMAAHNRWLQRIYEQRLIEVVLARKRAQIAARRLRIETGKVDQLSARVDFKNKLLAREHWLVSHDDELAARDRARERFALNRITLLNRWNHDLQLRLARVRHYLQWKYKHLQYLRARELQLSRAHYRLDHELAHEQYEARR